MQTVVEYLLAKSMRPIIRAGCFPGIMLRNLARRTTCVITTTTTTISTLALLEELHYQCVLLIKMYLMYSFANI